LGKIVLEIIKVSIFLYTSFNPKTNFIMKKHYILLILCLFISKLVFSQSTSIVPGGAYLNNNGAVNWLQLPVMHTPAIAAIIPPTATKGMMIYDCDLKCVKVFNGTEWNCLAEKSDCTPPGCSDARITGGSAGGMGGPAFPTTDAVAGAGDELFFIGNLFGSTSLSYLYNIGAITVPFFPYGNITAGYIAHQNSAGLIDWVKALGGYFTALPTTSGNVILTGVTYDAGNVYVVGHFDGQTNITISSVTTTYTSTGGTDFFIAKYDAAGNLLWFNQYGGAGNQLSTCITVDNVGDIYASGTNVGAAITFGSYTIPYSGGSNKDVFLVKLNASGTPQNAVLAASGVTVNSTSLAFSPLINSVFLVGKFQGGIAIGSPAASYTSSGNTDIFVAKYGQTLNYQNWNDIGGSTSSHILTSTKAVCNQYCVSSVNKPTLQIAANYSGSGITLFGNAIIGTAGGLILTLDAGSTLATIPTYKNLIAIQDWNVPSITKNFALGTNNTVIFPGIFTTRVSMINFNGEGTQNWVNYSSIMSSSSGNMAGYTIAKGVNKAFVVGSIVGQGTFGSTPTGNAGGVRTAQYIWQYYNCL
jgi:hypothetical protein